jgi:hypothetical protein
MAITVSVVGIKPKLRAGWEDLAHQEDDSQTDSVVKTAASNRARNALVRRYLFEPTTDSINRNLHGSSAYNAVSSKQCRNNKPEVTRHGNGCVWQGAKE